MKKTLSALVALLVLVASTFSYAAFPHNNRSDVKSTVKVFVPYTAFSIVNDASVGAGDPVVSEISTLGLASIKMEAAGDDAHVLFPLPDNACVSCPIKVSILWSTTSTTTTQTATWKVLYNEEAVGEAVTTAATALDTAITADSVLGTTRALNETPQGVISANTLDRGDILHILCELDAVSGLNPATTETNFHGMFIEYTREKL